MTEAEWLAAIDPTRMLAAIGASERKLRLFACACARRTWSLLDNEAPQQAIAVAERCADEPATAEQLAAAADVAWRYASSMESHAFTSDAHWRHGAIRGEMADIINLYAWAEAAKAAAAVASREPARAAELAAGAIRLQEHAREGGLTDIAPRALASEKRMQAQLLRDIIALHRPVIAPSCLAWQDGLVVKLARSAYEERELPSGHLASTRLAILADALEEAGCTDTDLLTHLRAPGPHVRGCLAVDAVLCRS